MVWSQVRRPQNSARWAAAPANDQLAPARVRSLLGVGADEAAPGRGGRPGGSGWRRSAGRRGRGARRRTSPAAVRTLRPARPLCHRRAGRRGSGGPAPLFFGGLGLGLQGGLDGLAGQFAGGGDGEGLDAGQDLAVGGGVGGGLQLLGEQEGLLDEQGLQGRLGVEGGALGHGGSSRAWVPRGYRQLTETTRNYSCTPSWGSSRVMNRRVSWHSRLRKACSHNEER